MDTTANWSDAMKKIDMVMVREYLTGDKQFTLSVSLDEAQPVLEECGMIWNPKSGTYQSLEEGDRWKVVEQGDGSVLVAPSPILFDTQAAQVINSPLLGGNELEDEAAKLDGLSA